MDVGNEQQVSVDVNNAVIPPTDPTLQMTTNSQDVTYEPADSDLVGTNSDVLAPLTALSTDLVAAQEALSSIRALTVWRATLEGYGEEPIPAPLQVATEVILDLTTRNTGLDSSAILPSVESLANATVSVEALHKYATRLLEALERLLVRIGDFLVRLYEALTSRMRLVRAEIVILRGKLSLAKGGRAKHQRFKVGGLGNLLVIRGIPVTTYSELESAFADIGGLVNSCLSTHLLALSDLGKELNVIVNSDSFPNPRATEARITRAFDGLDKTSLGLLCERSTGSDPRFDRAGYVTTASANLLGNKTIYKTKPKSGSSLNETFGTTTYALDHTSLKVANYEPKADQTFDTLSLTEVGKLLDSCSSLVGLVDRLDKSDIRTRILDSLSTLRNSASKRSKDGTLTGETSDLIQSSAIAFSDACSNPLGGLMHHLIQALNGGLKVSSITLDQFD